MIITNISVPDVPVANTSGNFAVAIYTDEPLQLAPGGGAITLTMRSSDPLVHGDLLFTYLDVYSNLPAGQTGWQATVDFSGCAGVTFTLDSACTFVNWDRLTSLDGDPLPLDLSGLSKSFIVGITGDLTQTLAPLTLQAAATVSGPRPLDGGSAADNALIARLLGDPILLGFCPHGVYWDLAPPGSKAFVIVSIVDAHDEPEFGGTAYEETLYAIEARMVAVIGQLTNIRAAADRIHTLLQDQPLMVPGYHWVSLHRDTEGSARIRRTDVEAGDQGVLWYRRGGYYRLLLTAATD
jgi:hypothetical protein